MSKHQLTTIFFISLLSLLAISGFFVAIKGWYFVVIALAWLLIVVVNSFSISSGFHVKAYCGNPSETRKIVAVTFDDGPHENTLLVLDILKKYGAKAAFFCIGKNIEKYPEILKRTIAEGHTIGNHSYSHSHFFDLYRKDRLIEELQKTDEMITQVSGRKPVFFRPPYGVTNPSIRRALTVTKHKVIGWNIRSLDGVLKDEATILNRIEKRIKPGGIILLHDTSIHTVNMLERLLVFLKDNNYTVVTLQELLKINN